MGATALDGVVEAGSGWDRVLLTALDHAIEHLQGLVFVEGMDALAAELGAEAALRASVTRYEQGLAHLFGFVRASGALADDVAWSTLKAGYRRALVEAGVEISLRTALETGMYVAQSVPLGEHQSFRPWSVALTRFLMLRAREAPGFPSQASDEERLYWAYGALSALEDHGAFHRTVLAAIDPSLDEPQRVAIIDHQARLLELPRFDLVLNACLLWLAEHGDARGGCA